MRLPRIRLVVAASALAIGPFLVFPNTPALAWAPARTAKIHPGVMTFTGGGQCTANFVFTSGGAVYLGQAAHCASTRLPTETNGCTTPSMPNGTSVEIRGASSRGTMVYSSWNAMKAFGETDDETCRYNDFALVRLNGSDPARTNPSVPHWGGPTGLVSKTRLGAIVYGYGNSILRGGAAILGPKEGVSFGQSAGGWNQQVFTVTPGIPGDSGGGYMTIAGKAFGLLRTINLAPVPASNGVGNLLKALQYMASHGGPSVQLAKGTEPFKKLAAPIGN